MRARALAPLVAAATLALPAAAQAAVRCVGTSGGDCTTTHANTADALAAAVDGVDTIRFGPGTFDPVNTTKVLTFVGAGAGTPDSAAGATVLQATTVGDPGMGLLSGGTVRTLRAVGGPGQTSPGFSAGGTGIEFSPMANGDMSLDLTDVIAVGGGAVVSPGAGLATGVTGTPTGTKVATVTRGAVLSGSGGVGSLALYTCCLELTLKDTLIRSSGGAGMYASIGSRTTLDGSTVEATDAIQTQAPTSLTVRRTKLTGTYRGLSISSDSSAPTATDVSVRNSLVTAGSDSAAGLAAAQIQSNGSRPVNFSALGSTFIARGNTMAAVYATRTADGSPPLTATLRNSIARVQGTGTDLWADRAPIGADFSSFTTRKLENGGTAPEPGSASNVAGDPMLAADYSLQPGSPLIDRGDPSVLLPGELDLAGAARSQDGTGDCVAVPDIGAFERPDTCPIPPNVPPVLSKVSATNRVFAPVARRTAHAAVHRRRVKRGTRFRYTLSEAARVRIRIERVIRRRGDTRYRKVTVLVANKQAGRQSTRFTGRVRRKALKPGRYRARLVATDAGGLKSRERRLKLRIVRP